ncbi:hypothetical protein NDU88_003087 [Pleurodeles waltl]|uniref:Reverse transcriptase n=1 Tax=Pleurodeles waltl TaxID=8319 RepID=A0AAV7LG45_PLEWA|nr:hypothetical protein NDU88_003087 [Pleurodeles waltl]
MGRTVGIQRTLERELIRLEKIIHEGERERKGEVSEHVRYEQAKISQSRIEEQLRCHSVQRYLASIQAEEDRSGKMMAWLVKPGGGMPIMSVNDMRGERRHKLGDINDAFREYYTFLYRSPDASGTESLDAYLQALPLNILTYEERDRLGGPVMLEKVREAITQLAAGKTPGTDGLPMDFYKRYSALLAPQLVEMYAEAFQEAPCPTR